MSARRRAALLSFALLAAGLPLAGGQGAAASACGTVDSLTRDGAPVPTSWVQTVCFGGEGDIPLTVGWSIWTGPWQEPDSTAGLDLGPESLDDTYTLTVDTGTIIPRVTDTKGALLDVTRARGGDGHWRVTITAMPVISTGSCDMSEWPWTCPTVATEQRDYLGGYINDFSQWTDAKQRKAAFGMDYASNIDAGGPPQVVPDGQGGKMIRLDFANSHFLKSPSGAVFKGSARIVVPNAFLKAVYGVDDPASLTAAGLDPDLTGKGAGTVSVTDIGGALRIDVNGMTFSKRSVKIHRGTITPAKPRHLSAERIRAAAVKLRYDRAQARGSAILGYIATCIAQSGPKSTVTVHDSEPSTTVRGLRANTEYRCNVRARSKAGVGGSAKVTVARKP